MITPKLEKLIWEGKAFFKTFVAGPQKTTLNIDNDRFIIITDITFTGAQLPGGRVPENAQLNIYGEKGFNHYIFRNFKLDQQVYFNLVPNYIDVHTATEPQTIHCYLLHTTAVGFSFVGGTNYAGGTLGVASIANPSLQPPLDYGKEGDTGAIPVITDANSGGIVSQFTNLQDGKLRVGINSTNQAQFPAFAGSLFAATGTPFFACANINYVEVLGQPENMQF